MKREFLAVIGGELPLEEREEGFIPWHFLSYKEIEQAPWAEGDFIQGTRSAGGWKSVVQLGAQKWCVVTASGGYLLSQEAATWFWIIVARKEYGYGNTNSCGLPRKIRRWIFM